MASTYTSNSGIEKIGSGEQAGTWGTTTNLNFDIFDRAINGVGAISLSGKFTQTAEISTISSGVIDFNSLFTQTTENIAIVNFTDVTMSSIFTNTTNALALLSGVSSQDLNFTKTTSGDILFVEIVPEANETFTEITPSGTETWTEITPSGTETYTEINA